MNEMYSKCGFRCDLCPAFSENIKSIEDQISISKGWSKYYGFEMPPEKIFCMGCKPKPDEYILPDAHCPVMPCATQKEYNTCAECDEVSCEKLRQRAEGYLLTLEKYQNDIPQEDYIRFILPYEGNKNLEVLRMDRYK